MKQYIHARTALLLILIIGGVSCSQIEEDTLESSFAQLVINVSDSGMINSDVPQSRTIDKDYATTFTQGDRMGLFAVKDGSLIEGMQNLMMTYNGTGWTPRTPLLYDEEESAGITYYAYYPYKEGLENKVNLNGDDFFATIVSEWETGNDQSTQDKYSNFDLMTSGATSVTNINGRHSLQFNLVHRMGLLVIKLPSTEYEFVDNDGNPVSNANYQPEPYIISPSEVKFYIGSVSEDNQLNPYKLDANFYHLMINPQKAKNVIGQFNGRQYTVETTNVSAGKYKRFLVDGGQRVYQHFLQVGDYYCADGNIVSKEKAAPEDCIGIVCYVGETRPSMLYNEIPAQSDALLRDYPTCNHGLVLALNETGVMKFADTKSYNLGNLFKEKDWMSQYITLADAHATGSLTNNYIAGYNNTKVMERLINEIISETPAVSSTAISYVLQELKKQTENAAPSSVSTDWFMPSAHELRLIFDNYDLLNNSLSNTGKDILTDVYWASTERNASNQWVYSSSKKYDFTGKTSTTYRFRFILAF